MYAFVESVAQPDRAVHSNAFHDVPQLRPSSFKTARNACGHAFLPFQSVHLSSPPNETIFVQLKRKHKFTLSRSLPFWFIATPGLSTEQAMDLGLRIKFFKVGHGHSGTESRDKQRCSMSQMTLIITCVPHSYVYQIAVRLSSEQPQRWLLMI